jgi:hypothetical protein
MSGISPLIPLPGHHKLLIRIVPKSHRYHIKLRSFVELFRLEEETPVSVGEKEVGSITELLRATFDLAKQELKPYHPTRSAIQAFIIDYLSRYLFPEDQEEITEDMHNATSEPLLEDVKGVGDKVVAELRKKGITDINQLSRAPEDLLKDEIKYLGEKRSKSIKEEVKQILGQNRKSTQTK